MESPSPHMSSKTITCEHALTDSHPTMISLTTARTLRQVALRVVEDLLEGERVDRAERCGAPRGAAASEPLATVRTRCPVNAPELVIYPPGVCPSSVPE